MATHGLLLGGAAGAGLFAVLYRKPFLLLADALVIPGAFLMGIGRVGNFIDGQIVGALTDAWWAVKFPDADGFRHPVVLYDGAKNLLLLAYLMRVRRVNTTPGATAARFVFWYAFPRFFIDLFRDYPTHRLALGTGQTLNIVMALVGAVLLYRSRLRRLGRLESCLVAAASRGRSLDAAPLASQRIAFVSLLAFCLTIPSNWTQDIPSRYGRRHVGLEHSWLYPMIDTAPPPAPAHVVGISTSESGCDAGKAGDPWDTHPGRADPAETERRSFRGGSHGRLPPPHARGHPGGDAVRGRHARPRGSRFHRQRRRGYSRLAGAVSR
ncbi:MAG: prolipoprotein diacylglyceryl transferase [Vicinamibacterales bacterium]